MRYINYFELVLTSKEYARSVMEFKPVRPPVCECQSWSTDDIRTQDWLLEVAPHAFNKKDIEDDKQRKMPKQIKQ